MPLLLKCNSGILHCCRMRKMKSKRITILNNRTAISASPWFRPYVNAGENRKAALRQYTGGACAGVYLIRSSRTKEVLYIGFSYANLVKTLYRHFQSWTETNHTHATYPPNGLYQVRFLIGMDGEQARELERQLIMKHSPRDNGHKYIPKGYIPITQADAIDKMLSEMDQFPY